jgi:carboxyl-terminal processing protease
VPGEDSQYQGDLAQRYEHGEFFSQDSIKHEGPAYHTSLGRLVYGGGGITPDIFVPEDTLAMTSYYKQAAMSGIIVQFAFAYTDDNRRTLSAFKDMPELVKYLGKQNIVDKFASYADKNGLQRRNLMIQKSHKLLEKYIVSRVVYNILNEQDWLMYLNEDDKVVEKALQVLNNGTSFPKKSAHQK